MQISKLVTSRLTVRSGVLSFLTRRKAGMPVGHASDQHLGNFTLHPSPFTLHASPFTLHKLVLVLLLVALVAGCSALRLGYRHADTYFAWRADEYFDLDQRQKQDFNARLERLLAWHRYEQLPEYAVFLSTAITKAQPSLKHEDIIWFVDGITARMRIIIDRGIDDAVEMLSTLTPDQIAVLQKQWNRDNRKFVREYELEGTLGDRKQARLKRTVNQIEDWTGNLTDEQQQKIAALLEAVPHISHLRHQDRMRRQREFVELLKLRANRGDFQPKLHAWLRDWDRGRSPEYAKLANEVYDKRLQLYIAVDKLLTADQRRTAQRRLNRFVEDFKSLSVRPKSGASLIEPDKLAFF